MQVTVHADLVCAWCRLVTKRFEKAVAAADLAANVELAYLPYQLDAQASSTSRPMLEEMAELFGAEQALAMTAQMTEMGAAEGVVLRFDNARAANTFTAHRLLWLARREGGSDVQKRLGQALYDAQFVQGADLGDPALLAEVASTVGMAEDSVIRFLSSDEGAVEVRALMAEAVSSGIDAVPAFTFPDGTVVKGASSVQALKGALGRAAVGPSLRSRQD